MDNRKKELKQAFEVSCQVRKRDFLRQLNLPRIQMYKFLFSQIGYIRKRSWCISILILVLSILGLAFLPDTVLWLISGLTPLLALTIISESGRSGFYKMAELEMATCFSLRSVILARLLIMGLLNLLILGVLLPIGLWNGTAAPFAAILYIVTPFLLTAFLGLYIVRKNRGQDAMYACVGVTVGISIFYFFLIISSRLFTRSSILQYGL